ncbi:MAG: IreB family regulatory phosphoprotein [Clostridia bacterium]|jgi:uncharacterized protein (UPF0297 family)|nr:IreB family regulatory phosphoprotein [Clostridia bacterium]MBQ1963649.1 IreB family regulatory phosphoprotein [Clostridia bacterium]MBQ5834058.1 IreB family regulatory phosphoprotein [Clostridia bacterium]
MNQDKNHTLREESAASSREILREVHELLSEKGYNPIGQIVGYLLSEDPTYITNCNNARALIRKIDRDELMQELVKNFLQLED